MDGNIQNKSNTQSALKKCYQISGGIIENKLNEREMYLDRRQQELEFVQNEVQ